ncbi:hypothetical protein [Sulfuricurvum sp.]|uniref:hypothetical protein n=1 Tax=Sulfuricurvum sp. TaxID=2025608 RepID=UPI002E303A16|nr:hypothetical protein [Sulfuricurvum sp.]HEX5329881.1 hypothetical protein [Sulfuricurvum sp.]
MTNMLALVLIVAIGYWVIIIISRKKRELEQKELQQAEQFLKETQALLKEETSPLSEENTSTHPYREKVAEHFQTEGYNITEISKAEGIDLIGIKDKALVLIRCEEKLKEIKKVDIKLFIAECSVYVDNNPMFKGRSCTRVFATNRPITEEVSLYLRDNPSSIRLLEEI